MNFDLTDESAIRQLFEHCIAAQLDVTTPHRRASQEHSTNHRPSGFVSFCLLVLALQHSQIARMGRGVSTAKATETGLRATRLSIDGLLYTCRWT